MKYLAPAFVLALFVLTPAVLAAAEETQPPAGAAPPAVEPAAVSDTEALAKATQNPVADLISVPFQSNVNFGQGRDDDVQYILNVKPVIPVALSEDWNLITRWVTPLIYQPSLAHGMDGEFGLGDINPTFLLSPVKPGNVIWGFGPTFTFPTATEETLGSDKVSVGPAAVVVAMKGPWVCGALANNQWSFAGESGAKHVNAMLLQPFFNYNLPGGTYLTSSPVITANWADDSDWQWTIPVGGGMGRIVKFGKLPVNLQLSAYYNIERPGPTGADWQLRFQVQFVFPKRE